ncbi:ABC transporter ATP-binding protein [Paracidovorax avenae]|uniref:dipeptide ABC transporter ATP-binding protein n=1 Tax=Paracidovorax avenae TaxID=80867 RepID=UPI000D17D7A5|nr:ABC transporter ATP-binding protein [Paracidovorax avenae]AVS62295.1 ABC transporter ATP-binding protein [Paracidovorax avenae]
MTKTKIPETTPVQTCAEAVLSVRGLGITLPGAADRSHAVRDLSFELRRGQTLCLVGESGSGKSMTALALMGLLDPALRIETGQALFEQQNLLALPERARRRLSGRRIAMIFQEPMASLNPAQRIETQVAEVFRLHTDLPRAEVRMRVLRLLDDVGLPDPERLARAYPHQLSGGQCQRVAIAMAIALEPAVLIADEPTTALDVGNQRQVLELIAGLQRRLGTAVLFITHDLGVVGQIADEVVVMQHGLAVESGPVTELLDRPRHDYTRRLIGAMPTLTPRPARPNTRTLVLEARGLGKRYASGARTVVALDDVELLLRRGETVAVVGESGSGKSSLARAVVGLMPLDTGTVRVSGEPFSGVDARRLRGLRKRVQIVFQDPYSALDPRQTVGDAIAEGAIIHGMPPAEARQRAAGWLEAVGLSARAAQRYPHEFSGGQRQRVCIARALAVEPELLIADESVAALDVSIQQQVLALLAELQARLSFGLLFITHDLRVASSIADRIAVMHQGRIVETAPPDLLFSSPRHAYTRQLLAALPKRRD